MQAVPHLEEAWRNNNKAAEHDALCQYPDFVLNDHSENLRIGTTDLPQAITDTAN